MKSGHLIVGAVAGALLALSLVAAQLAPPPSDPLARIRANAEKNAQACTVQASSPCAEANPKIIAAAQGSPSLEPNVRALMNLPGSPAAGAGSRAVQWALAAFKAAGVDQVYTEPAAKVLAAGTMQSNARRIPPATENVVAEIRGREKADQYVLLASRFSPGQTGQDRISAASGAALLIEAARAIHLTGLRPRRSLRFVLFGGDAESNQGSWSYVQFHRPELDRVIAAVSLDGASSRITGFSSGGRPELDPAVREVLLAAFDTSWGLTRFTSTPFLDSDAFDFFLEGVPALTANRVPPAPSDDHDRIDFDALKNNAAIAGVLAFGLAEREMPLGSRLSRPQLEALLSKTGIETPMRQSPLWNLWQSGARGRQP